MTTTSDKHKNWCHHDMDCCGCTCKDAYTEYAEAKAATQPDPVNHPTHYAEGWSNGAEVIDITENLNFCRGNAVKYLARAGAKDPTKELEDLRKAAWYVQREIDSLTPA